MLLVCLLIFCGYFECVEAFEKQREGEEGRRTDRGREVYGERSKGQAGKIEISEILLLFFK